MGSEMPPCNITLYQWCVYWLLGSSKDLREGLKINKGPLLGYIGSLHLWLPVGLQSIQFRPPYKVRIVRRFLTLWPTLFLLVLGTGPAAYFEDCYSCMTKWRLPACPYFMCIKVGLKLGGTLKVPFEISQNFEPIVIHCKICIWWGV